MKKRFLSLLVACLTVLSLLPMAASAEDRPTLTILMAQDTYVEDYETNEFTKFIEDSMNVNLVFSLLPSTNKEALDKLAVMINSGQKLPDIINISLDTTTTYRYAQSGAIIPLDEYYESLGANTMTIFGEEPELLDYFRCPDGHLYSIPIYNKGLHDEVRYKIWINTQWLENLGLDMPQTTDELYTVLKAFKEDDPNGNGKQDEYPLVGGTGWSQDPTVYLMNAFIWDDNADHFIVDDGKIDVVYTKDQWKEGLLYMRSLVDEKLLDPITFTQDDAQLRAMANNEDGCIVGAFAFSSITLLPVATSPYVGEFNYLPPVEGPEGVRLSGYVLTMPTNRWFITADCENPELAFQVGDFMFDPTEEVFLRARFGVEDVHWHRVPEGTPSMYDGYEAFFEMIENIWAISQNAHWRNNAPLYSHKVSQGERWDGDPDNYLRKIGLSVGEYRKYLPEEGTFVPVLTFDDEEIQRISEIRATLQSYVKECKARFITRDMDIETEWDSYLNEINRIGIEEFLAVCQGAYDRMYK